MSVDLFEWPDGWTEQRDASVARLADGSLLSRGHFIADVNRNAGCLQQLPGDEAVLFARGLYAFAVGLFALAAAGKRVVVAANELPATLAQLAETTSLLVTDGVPAFPGIHHRLDLVRAFSSEVDAGSREENATKQRLGALSRFGETRKCSSEAGERPWPRIKRAAPVRFFTSGSTGEPKRIDKQLGHLIAEGNAISALFAARRPDFQVVGGTVPHHHAYGLAFRLIWPLVAGLPFMDDTPEFLEQGTAQFLAGAVFVTSPAHLNRLDGLAPLPAERQAACILSAGAPLGQVAAEQAQRLLGCAVTEIYGSTETGALASRERDAAGSAWRPLPGVSVALAPSGIAEVRAAHVPGDKALLSDDLSLLPDGSFALLGRRDRVVKIEAKRVSLDEVESRLRTLDEVADAIVIALGDPARLAACVVPSAAGASFLANRGAFRFNRRLRAALASQLEAASLPRQWRFVERLPHGTLGKASHFDVEKLFDDQRPMTQRPGTSEPNIASIRAIPDGVQIDLSVPDDLADLAGHFPGMPIIPGVTQIDWAIRLAARHLGLAIEAGMSLQVKYRKLFLPGRLVTLTLVSRGDQLRFNYAEQGEILSSGSIRLPPQGGA
ncbi:AMP-binding protein [Bosea sp. F3-2]|uniref:AMP-binding protein n=1 Tax=Bosea sp. F3-2 TaxID=2599640 RepID=UPI0011EBBCD0|nr:AMP-binding protein [Bosea sp. F3-2]QEL25131.1 AMP-binding protein [Bosea sp. F3-2]